MAYTVYPPGGQPQTYTNPNMPPMAGTPVSGGYNPATQPWWDGNDPNGAPANSPWSFPGGMPGFVQGYDPSKSLYGQMQGELDSIQPDMSGYDMFKQQAERTGPSAWAGLMNQQQDMLAKNAKSAGAATVAGQNQGAYDSLAMHGGLDSGARERVAREGSKSYLDMTQGVNRDTANNKLQIGVNDEQNRISQLSSLPGMYNQVIQPQMQKINMEGQARQIDNSNAIAESDRQNQYNLGKYQTQMQGWGAGQQAYATAHSGKK